MGSIPISSPKRNLQLEEFSTLGTDSTMPSGLTHMFVLIVATVGTASDRSVFRDPMLWGVGAITVYDSVNVSLAHL